jgi:hypothetical protein
MVTKSGECQEELDNEEIQGCRDVGIVIGIDANAEQTVAMSPSTSPSSAINDEFLSIPEAPPTTPSIQSPRPFSPVETNDMLKTKRRGGWIFKPFRRDLPKDSLENCLKKHIRWLQELLGEKCSTINRLIIQLKATQEEIGRLRIDAASHIADMDRLRDKLDQQGGAVGILGNFLKEACFQLWGQQQELDVRSTELTAIAVNLVKTDALVGRVLAAQQKRDEHYEQQLARLHAELQDANNQAAVLRTERDDAVARCSDGKEDKEDDEEEDDDDDDEDNSDNDNDNNDAGNAAVLKQLARRHCVDRMVAAAATSGAAARLAMARVVQRDGVIARLRRVIAEQERELVAAGVTMRELQEQVKVLEREGDALCENVSRWRDVVLAGAGDKEPDSNENGSSGHLSWCDVGSVEEIKQKEDSQKKRRP